MKHAEGRRDPYAGRRARERRTAVLRPPHRTALRPPVGAPASPAASGRAPSGPVGRRIRRRSFRPFRPSAVSRRAKRPARSGRAGARRRNPDRPWWRSAPRVAIIAAMVVAAVILRGSHPARRHQQALGRRGLPPGRGQDRTRPVHRVDRRGQLRPARHALADGATESAPSTPCGVDGGAPGLYGGTRNVASCDVEKQITALQAGPGQEQGVRLGRRRPAVRRPRLSALAHPRTAAHGHPRHQPRLPRRRRHQLPGRPAGRHRRPGRRPRRAPGALRLRQPADRRRSPSRPRPRRPATPGRRTARRTSWWSRPRPRSSTSS